MRRAPARDRALYPIRTSKGLATSINTIRFAGNRQDQRPGRAVKQSKLPARVGPPRRLLDRPGSFGLRRIRILTHAEKYESWRAGPGYYSQGNKESLWHQPRNGS